MANSDNAAIVMGHPFGAKNQLFREGLRAKKRVYRQTPVTDGVGVRSPEQDSPAHPPSDIKMGMIYRCFLLIIVRDLIAEVPFLIFTVNFMCLPIFKN
jgi:hypothetical protein